MIKKVHAQISQRADQFTIQWKTCLNGTKRDEKQREQPIINLYCVRKSDAFKIRAIIHDGTLLYNTKDPNPLALDHQLKSANFNDTDIQPKLISNLHNFLHCTVISVLLYDSIVFI